MYELTNARFEDKKQTSVYRPEASPWLLVQ